MCSMVSNGIHWCGRQGEDFEIPFIFFSHSLYTIYLKQPIPLDGDIMTELIKDII